LPQETREGEKQYRLTSSTARLLTVDDGLPHEETYLGCSVGFHSLIAPNQHL
jgi:hypothetical protein